MEQDQKKFIYGSLNDLKKSNARILAILEKDESIGEIGLVKEVRCNTKDIRVLKRDKAVQAGKMTVYGAIGTFVTLLIYTVIQIIITKKINGE